jgi:hypothetical protein
MKALKRGSVWNPPLEKTSKMTKWVEARIESIDIPDRRHFVVYGFFLIKREARRISEKTGGCVNGIITSWASSIW